MTKAAPARYVTLAPWVQQHIGADAESTYCEMPIAGTATWSGTRTPKKPLCGTCVAVAGVYAAHEPAVAPRQLGLSL